MRKFKTIYKHLGYFNDYTSIQDMCSIGPAPSNTFHFDGGIAVEMLLNQEGCFMEDTNPDENDVLILEEEKDYYLSNDKKFVVTNSVHKDILDVDVTAEGYDPNMVDCVCYVDIWEFDHIEPYITLDDLSEMVEARDLIVIGLSFNSKVTTQATSWINFKRNEFTDFDEWIKRVYREFYFQLNRDDVYYIELTAHKTDVLYKP